MPERQIIVDTGPLVAFLVPEEQHHAWSVDQFRKLRAPLITCEPVLAEAFHLVARRPRGTEQLFGLLESGAILVNFALIAELAAVHSLVRKYANVPMSLADGCLVRMAELIADSTIFTLDSDFYIYRKLGRQRIPLIIPGD